MFIISPTFQCDSDSSSTLLAAVPRRFFPRSVAASTSPWGSFSNFARNSSALSTPLDDFPSIAALESSLAQTRTGRCSTLPAALRIFSKVSRTSINPAKALLSAGKQIRNSIPSNSHREAYSQKFSYKFLLRLDRRLDFRHFCQTQSFGYNFFRLMQKVG